MGAGGSQAALSTFPGRQDESMAVSLMSKRDEEDR